MTDEPTVFVVDDDQAMRKSLRWLIESIDLKVETYESAPAFLNAYHPDRPGCVVLDVRMPGMSGLDLQDHLGKLHFNIPIIMITAHGEVPMAVRAIKGGALDFIEKPVCDQVLLDHIQAALDLDQARRQSRTKYQEIARRLDSLTNREAEVKELVVDGLSSKEIAEQLGVSFKTVEAHRSKIMKKMNAKSVPHLIHMSLLTRESKTT